MKEEKETKARLLASAKAEFMEKGYMQASLRNICKDAGVTTGALYFFFQDKEDLFAAIVEEPLNALLHVMKAHYQTEREQAKQGIILNKDFSEDLDIARQVIHFLYLHYDEFILILKKSQGSRFEDSFERFVAITEEHYRGLFDKFAEITGEEKMDRYMLHWMAHMQMDIFVHMLTHEESEENAAKNMADIMNYLIKGWAGIFERLEKRSL